jgi:hypothetical protein
VRKLATGDNNEDRENGQSQVDLTQNSGSTRLIMIFDRIFGRIQFALNWRTLMNARFSASLGVILSLATTMLLADGRPAPKWPYVEKAVHLEDGDWIVYRYMEMSDSGVEVYRMDSVMTKERWHTECKPLGVEHSRYYHKADLEVKGNEATVTSIANHGHGGRFDEKLDLTTGKQISRTQKKPGEAEK